MVVDDKAGERSKARDDDDVGLGSDVIMVEAWLCPPTHVSYLPEHVAEQELGEGRNSSLRVIACSGCGLGDCEFNGQNPIFLCPG